MNSPLRSKSTKIVTGSSLELYTWRSIVFFDTSNTWTVGELVLGAINTVSEILLIIKFMVEKSINES